MAALPPEAGKGYFKARGIPEAIVMSRERMTYAKAGVDIDSKSAEGNDWPEATMEAAGLDEPSRRALRIASRKERLAAGRAMVLTLSSIPLAFWL